MVIVAAIVLDLAALPFAVAQTPAAVLAYVFFALGVIFGVVAIAGVVMTLRMQTFGRAILTVVMFVPAVNALTLILLALLSARLERGRRRRRPGA